MKDLLENKAVRKIMYRIQEQDSIYLWLCLLLRKRMRLIYRNYKQNRNKVLDDLLAYELPRSLYFEGTNICNANCVFCGYSQMKRPKLTMNMEFFKDVINQYVAMGGRSVGFTPIVGDPLLDKFLFERIDYLNSFNQITNISFYTNAIALTKEKADWIINYKGNALFYFNISFGGFDRETFKRIMGVDRFDLVKENITYFLERMKKVINSSLVVKIDFRCGEEGYDDTFFSLLRDAIRKGIIKHDTLGNTFDTFGGYIKESDLEAAGLKLNLGYPKIGPCDILFRKPLILADGRVNACAERDLETTLVIGDLKKQSLKEILCSAERRKLIDRFYTRSLPPVCKDCTVYQSIYDKKSKVWKKNLNWAER